MIQDIMALPPDPVEINTPAPSPENRRPSSKASRRVARDVARVCVRNREFRLALAILIWPPGWSHTRLEKK